VKLEDKLLLITGAPSGIGAATARGAAKLNLRLVLLARSEFKLRQLAKEISCRSRTLAFWRAADLGDPEQVAPVAAEISSEVGIPDIVLNSVGAGRWLSLIETEPIEAAGMIAVPYLAAFYLTRAFLLAMLNSGSGRCVFANSVASRLVWPGAAGYTARALGAARPLRSRPSRETAGSGVGASMVTFAKIRSDYWANSPGSEERVPKAQAAIPVLSVAQAAQSILKDLETDKEEIIEPLALRFVLKWNHWFPVAGRKLMRG
jgi:uncharacterized protein